MNKVAIITSMLPRTTPRTCKKTPCIFNDLCFFSPLSVKWQFGINEAFSETDIQKFLSVTANASVLIFVEWVCDCSAPESSTKRDSIRSSSEKPKMTVTVMMMMMLTMFTKQHQTVTIRKQSSDTDIHNQFMISNFFVVESIFVMLQ